MSNYIRAMNEDFGENTESSIIKDLEPCIEIADIKDITGIRLRYKDGSGQLICQSYLDNNPDVMISSIQEWIIQREEWIKK